MVFGNATGTLPTGLALLRVIDADFETPVASDYMYSAGITFVLAIPFILAINLPAYSIRTGNFLYFWLAVLVALGYLIFVLAAYLLISKKRAFRSASKVWLHDE
jgi:ESS family glutamate:Na+ symporter